MTHLILAYNWLKKNTWALWLSLGSLCTLLLTFVFRRNRGSEKAQTDVSKEIREAKVVLDKKEEQLERSKNDFEKKSLEINKKFDTLEKSVDKMTDKTKGKDIVNSIEKEIMQDV